MYNTNLEISKRINKIMFDLGMNQNQLAKMLNISQPAVSKYLKGRIPPPDILLQLSRLSGNSIEWLLTGKIDYYSKNRNVSDNAGQYNVTKIFEKKFRSLPEDVQIKIVELIESILNAQ